MEFNYEYLQGLTILQIKMYFLPLLAHQLLPLGDVVFVRWLYRTWMQFYLPRV